MRQVMSRGMDQVLGQSSLRSVLEPLAEEVYEGAKGRAQRRGAITEATGEAFGSILGPHASGVAERFGLFPQGAVPGAQMVGGGQPAPTEQDLVALGADELAAALSEQVGGRQASSGAGLRLNIPGLTVDTTPLLDARRALEAAIAGQAGVEDKAVRTIQGAISKATGAQEKLGAVEERVAQSSAGVLSGMMDGLRKVDEEQRGRQADAEKAYQQSLSAWDEAKRKRAEAALDPQKIWGEGGAGAMMRIGAGISIALGHLGATLAGGPNTALNIIERSIDRALKAQESQIAGKEADARNALTSVGLARQMWQDAGTARMAAKLDMMEQAKLQLELINKRADSERVKANTDVAIGGLEERMGKLEADLHASAFGRELSGQQARAGIASQELAAERQNKAAELQTWNIKRELSTPRKRPALPPTIDYASEEFQPTQKQIDAGIKADSQVNKIRPTLGRLIAWRKAHGAEILGGRLSSNKLTETVAEGERLAKRLLIGMKVADNMGANFTESEQAMEDIPWEDPGAFGNYLKSLETLEQTFELEHAGFLESYGLKPRRRGSARRVLVKE
jgi:hypothetical protein